MSRRMSRHMSRRIPSLVAVTLTAAGLGIGACADRTTDQAGAAPPSNAAFPVTVGTLTLDQRPTKIVSLSPTATETLFAVGAGPQVKAADDNSNYPPEAPKTALSGFKPNAEAIAAYQPDLVVISNDTDQVSAALTRLKIPVFLAPAVQTLDQAYTQINDLGRLAGHANEATALTTRMKDDLGKLVKDLPARAKPLTYYYELDPTLYTVTSKTLIGALFTLAGLQNIADPADKAGGGYPQLSAEALIQANPDMIFLADTKCCQQNAASVKARAGWSTVTAVKTGQIVALDDDVASRWGPRVVDLVRAVTDAVAKVAT
jgi:iron complex transport system substrate-binding protein